VKERQKVRILDCGVSDQSVGDHDMCKHSYTSSIAERERQTDRETERETDKKRERERERQREREREECVLWTEREKRARNKCCVREG
jgi:hypothetical protein